MSNVDVQADLPTCSAEPAFASKVRRSWTARSTAWRSTATSAADSLSHQALAIWSRGRAVRSHPYLARKDVGSHGLRQDRRGSLLLPMRDADGRIWSLQTIDATGGKLYLKGGRKVGAHAMLGELQPGRPLLIAEGYATAATLHEVTGLAVVAAFDSCNLMDVARAYRERDADRPIIFAADNDHHLPARAVPLLNVGAEKAVAAADAVCGTVLLPRFAAGDAGTDWNDFAAQHGRAALRQAVEAELSKQGVQLPAEAASAAAHRPVTQADRDTARQQARQHTVSKAVQQVAQEAAR